jgi:hypothetical protein
MAALVIADVGDGVRERRSILDTSDTGVQTMLWECVVVHTCD